INTKNLRRSLKPLAPLLLFLVISLGCTIAVRDTEERNGEGAEAEDRLEAHIGEEIEASVTNTTRGNGPYSLTVDIAGSSEVVIHFDSGGYRDINLYEDNPLMTDTWEGTDDAGDSWEIEPE